MHGYTDWTRVAVIAVISAVVGVLVGFVFHVTHDGNAAVAVGVGAATALYGNAMGFLISPKTPPSATSVAVAHADVVNSSPPPPMPPVTP